jgi:hypothetical protein
MMRKIPHNLYYLFELIVLIAGFYVIFLVSYNFQLQVLTLTLVLTFYAILGIVHHEIHHALNSKIVLEYILISLTILAIFFFLNIGRF